MKKWWTFVGLFLVLLTISGCSSHGSESNKINVATSAEALKYFITQVGGDEVEVTFSFTGSPHHVNLTQQDAANIMKATAFFNVEAGDYVDLGAQVITINQALKTFNVTKGITLIDSADEHDHGLEEKRGADRVTEDGNAAQKVLDPHIWLDPNRARTLVANIATGLSELKPEKRAFFDMNAKKVQDKLAVLDEKFQIELATKSKQYILVNHPAYGYLTERYNFFQKSIHDIADHSENTQQSIIDLDTFITEQGIRYIFIEPNTEASNVVQILREKHELELVELFNIETPVQESADYFVLMEQNLSHIKQAIV